MISVVISTYKRPDRLTKAIQSVLKQSYQDFEIIVVADGKKDPAGNVVTELYDKRIKYYEVNHLGNDTRAKNEGIRRSTGEYIAFLDDDCEYRPDHLQALRVVLDSNTELAMVYGDRWIIDEDNRIQPRIGVFSEFNPYLLLQRNYIDTSDVLVRKEALYEVGGFDERFKKYIDWNLWVRLMKAGYIFGRVPMVLTNYYLHSEQKSQRKEDERAFGVPAWDSIDCDIYVPHLRDIQPPKVAIFTITYNRLAYTKLAFESLRKTAGYAFDHYVVDNGSTDGTVEWLKTQKIFLIRNEKNVGISKASNQALSHIKGYQIIGKVDNDCIFTSNNWLNTMVNIWRGNRKIAMSCYIEGLKDNPGGAPRTNYGQIRGELLGMTRHLGGICVFTDAKAYENFRWDEKDFLHGAQDTIFSQHLLKNNYEMGYLENFYASHGPNGTESQHNEYKEYFERRESEKTTRYQP